MTLTCWGPAFLLASLSGPKLNRLEEKPSLNPRNPLCCCPTAPPVWDTGQRGARWFLTGTREGSHPCAWPRCTRYLFVAILKFTELLLLLPHFYHNSHYLTVLQNVSRKWVTSVLSIISLSLCNFPRDDPLSPSWTLGGAVTFLSVTNSLLVT